MQSGCGSRTVSMEVTMSRLLPQDPDIQHLKRQAKSLLRALRNNDPEAIERIRAEIPSKVINPQKYRLSDCQYVLAREYGFQSWVKLKAHVEAIRVGRNGIESVLQAFRRFVVSGDLSGLQALAIEYSWLSEHDIYTACGYGNVNAARRLVTPSPHLAMKPDVPKYGWPPLAYTCFSPLNRENSRQKIFAQIAEILLETGASPDTVVYLPDYPDRPLSCLYGALGLNRNAALGELLLQAGANPNDNESLYHSAEHPDNTCLKLLLDYKADPAGTNALLRKLDFDDLEGMEILLAYGADPDDMGVSAICHALERGRGTQHFESLLKSGADPQGCDRHGVSVYENALIRGRHDVMQLLERLSITYNATPAERFLDYCSRGDREKAKQVLAEYPALWDKLSEHHAARLSEAIWNGETSAALLMIDLGAPVNRAGSSVGPPLHVAAWMGNVAMVEVLLDKGADIKQLDQKYNLTAVGWAMHGSLHAINPDEEYIYTKADYCEVIRLLLDKGSVLPDTISASDEVVEYLEAMQRI